ncbi:hypothetical protein diail_10063 [Diaporthe ilicicola]|nr:hypothetical protein diail_10063 [Diaporthe ilicicola]
MTVNFRLGLTGEKPKFLSLMPPATVIFLRFLSVMQKFNCKDHFLAIRVLGTHLEVKVVLHFISEGHGQADWDSDPFDNDKHTTGPLANCDWRKEGSMASVVLGLLRLVRCDNEVIKRERGARHTNSLRMTLIEARRLVRNARSSLSSWSKLPKGGAGLLSDANRLNVVSTRATDFLIVVGDQDVAANAPGKNQADVDPKPLRDWINCFVTKRRMVDASKVDCVKSIDGSKTP